MVVIPFMKLILRRGKLLQGNDFKVLNERYGCKLQIGGSDQFGNAMTGIEVMRKSGINIDDCAVMTWPLVTRADGTKFGKSEGGKNIWLDPTMTSPYEFYQFWLNQSDEDAKNIRNRVLVTVLRELLLKQLDNSAFEPRKLKRDKVKEVLLSFRRSLQKVGSECIKGSVTTFDYV